MKPADNSRMSAGATLREGDDLWNDLLDRFDRARRGSQPARLEDFLPPLSAPGPPAGNPARRKLLEELVKIDLECSWRLAKTGAYEDCPRLENYLQRIPELGPRERLSLELIGWEYRVRQLWGDRPTHDQCAARFAHHEDALRQALARVDADLAAEFARQGRGMSPDVSFRQPTAPPKPLEPGSEVTVAAFLDVLSQYQLLVPAQLDEVRRQARGSDPRALATALLKRQWLTAYQVNQLFLGRASDLRLGPYLLLERLGEGGAGQVFKARHQKMNRMVALKLIRKELLTDAEVVGRFYREIQVLSRLDHPNVVHAFDAGPAGASHFLAMEYVEGTDLGKMVKEGGTLPVMQACAYIRQAALGLQHAHERGLVHRDIKPHNLIVSVRDGLVKVADLGLARLPRTTNADVSAALSGVQGTGTLTPENAVLMGTADYLAPEQALDFHSADIRADIYGLGCTFYYLLTGRPPFSGVTLAEKLIRHQQAEPPPLDKLGAQVPPPLVAVTRRMLAKRPEDRYQTPAEVAAALGPVLNIAGIPSGSAVTTPSASSEPTRVLKGPSLPPGSGRRSPLFRRMVANRGRMALAIGAILVLELTVAFWPSRRDRPVAKSTSRREQPTTSGKFQLTKVNEFRIPDQAWERVFAFGDNGKLVAFRKEKEIHIWKVASGKELAVLKGHKGPVSQLVFSPDGALLASGSRDERTWKLWDVHARRELKSTLRGPTAPDYFVFAFSHDGKQLAVNEGKDVALLDVASGKITHTFPLEGPASQLAWSADRRYLAVNDGGSFIRMFDTATRKQLATAGNGNHIPAIAFSPDSTLLAVTWVNNTIVLLSSDKLETRKTLTGDTGWPISMVFSPDGRFLTSVTSDKTVRLWDVASCKALATLGAKEGYTLPVRAVAFGPDSKTLLTAGDDDTVRIWRFGNR